MSSESEASLSLLSSSCGETGRSCRIEMMAEMSYYGGVIVVRGKMSTHISASLSRKTNRSARQMRL